MADAGLPASVFEADVRAGRVRDGMSFTERAWAWCARVPRGRVATYGDLAAALSAPGAARAVGRAMAVNPFAPGVPCHRVVASTGRLTGYAFGLDVKAARLRAEGVAVSESGRVDLAVCRWRPETATRQ